MNTILITGAAGFIGSHVAENLLTKGYRVVGIDNLNDYYPVRNKERNLEILKNFAGFTFYKADFEDLKSVRAVFRSHDISHIGHLGARAGVRPSIKDPGLYVRANVVGTLNLLECAKETGCENFVMTSSSSVYGNSKQIPFREDDAATDRPVSPYAATKKACEVLCHSYHCIHGMNTTIIRPFTVYGPRGRPDMMPWVFMESMLKGLPIERYGDGTTRRDYTFIDDFVKGFVPAIERPLGYDIFNLGNSQTVALNDAIAAISETAGMKPVIRQLPMQPGDVEVTYADITKAREKLGYNPSTSFKEGMRKFHDWFVKQDY